MSGEEDKVEIKTRADFALDIPRPGSLPAESKVTLQVGLMIMLSLVTVIALVGAILGVVDKGTLSNILSADLGGILGLLTGGSRIVR